MERVISERYSCDPVGLKNVHVPLEKILSYASSNNVIKDLPQLQPGDSVTFTRANLCWFLANSFLGKNKLHWTNLFVSSSREARERLKCICDYFDKFESAPPGDVTIRLVSGNAKLDETMVLSTDHVMVHTQAMEVKEGAFVDFANENLHIHRIIPSLTQEEILFSMCSECFIAILIVPTLKDNEAVIFENVWRHSSYYGYLGSFTFMSEAPFLNVTNIVAIDAAEHSQYEECERDINKAIVGFSNVSDKAISTGKWGCGAFGGNIELKFVQQLMAAQITGKQLFYSSFGSDDEAERYFELIKLIDAKKPTFGWIVKVMKGFAGYEFGHYLINKLKKL